MLELFQYTACRSLALDRCKFASASVTRLRENVARAIIPLRPLLVQPWIPSFSFTRPRSVCPRRRVVHNIPSSVFFSSFFFSQVPSYLNDRLDPADFRCLRVPQLKSHCDESHVDTSPLVSNLFWTSSLFFLVRTFPVRSFTCSVITRSE